MKKTSQLRLALDGIDWALVYVTLIVTVVLGVFIALGVISKAEFDRQKECEDRGGVPVFGGTFRMRACLKSESVMK